MQGKGQHVDMALLDCSVGLLASQALHYLVTGANPPRMGNAHAQVSAYGVFPAADGPIILAPANDGLLGTLPHTLGRDDRDRKSVELGKSVSVRVGLGGRRILKNKT